MTAAAPQKHARAPRWPQATDSTSALHDPSRSFGDPELVRGQPAISGKWLRWVVPVLALGVAIPPVMAGERPAPPSGKRVGVGTYSELKGLPTALVTHRPGKA